MKSSWQVPVFLLKGGYVYGTPLAKTALGIGVMFKHFNKLIRDLLI
jgi:hypothetical protein